MKAAPTYRLQAATLVEVLVAMALASIVFGIGAATWLQLNGRHAPWRSLDQRLLAREMLWEAGQPGAPVENTLLQGPGAYLVRECTLLNAATDLYQVDVKCYSHSDQLLFQRSKIIRIHES